MTTNLILIFFLRNSRIESISQCPVCKPVSPEKYAYFMKSFKIEW